MKLRYFTLIGAGLLAINAAKAQQIIDITGSTAGRSAVHDSILAVLSDETYAYTGATLAGAGSAIFKGTYLGQAVVVRTTWSGSATGIASVSGGTNVNFIPTSAPTSPSGTPNAAAPSDPSAPEVAFSDVFVSSTTVPPTGLVNRNTFVLPFKFIASASANAVAGFNNITPNQARTMLNQGALPLSFFTGVAADVATTVLPTGRDAGSGTRITTVADIGYGVFSEVQQVSVTVTSGNITGFASFPGGPNDGYTSGSTLAGVLNKPSTGDAASFLVVGYLGLSDAANTALTGPTPAKELAYNGVTYSADNVKNGKYSLWGYFHMYYMNTFTGLPKQFSDALADVVTANPGSAGIVETQMNVQRLTDGGNITLK